ncbi:MAG TPA: transketolase [Actinomycetota bacterium]|nr:transketolase [Actinomycetota bacterium]
MDDRTTLWNEIAAQLCVDSIRCTTAAGSGHPTSSMSAAHLLAVLYADHFRTDVAEPHSLANDRFVMSKGHASPLLYSVLKAIGAISDDELLSLRTMGSPVQGHPVPVDGMPWIDVATGSLGQGLPIALGMAFAMRLDKAPGRVWCLMGDSETAEGSVWEAMQAASFHRVRNLVAILDMNRLGQRGPTMLEWDGGAYVRRAEAFGWRAIEVDGHDVAAIDEAYTAAEGSDGPVLIVARTEKGHGVSFLANAEGWHGKALDADQAEQAIAELGGARSLIVEPNRPPAWKPTAAGELSTAPAPSYDEMAIPTRKAFGETLAWLAGHRPEVVVLDGEVGNSTHTEDVEKVAPQRFLQLYIAEQCMIGAQVGLQALGKVAWSATFGAFFTRALDFVRMGSIGRADLRLCGSHAGVSIGEDGPSQMALEDLAAMRTLDSSTVLYPADGNATVKLVEQMCDLPGISYVRTTREKTPALYPSTEEFPIGGSKTLAAGPSDRATLVGAGITLHESLGAAEMLGADGIVVRVIDCYSVKPIDTATLRRAIDETGLLIVVEDHRIEGGLGEAVLAALASTGALAGTVVRIGVTSMPGSGKPEELRDWAGISARRIASTVRERLGA